MSRSFSRLPTFPWQDLSGTQGHEPSRIIRERVERARDIQRVRFEGRGRVVANSQMASRDVRRHCRLPAGAEELLRTAMSRLGLSARAYHRVLKLARTIADLAGEIEIAAQHVAEAIQYRALDRARP